MWFKLSLLLLLLFACCFNLASTRHTKNLRKSLSQKFGDHGVMDDSSYRVDSNDDVPQNDMEYKNVGSNDDKHPIDVQDEIQHDGYDGGGYDKNQVPAKQPQDFMDDSSSIEPKQKQNETQNGYGNGEYNIVPVKRNRRQDHGLMNGSSSDGDIENQTQGGFRLKYSTTEETKDSTANTIMVIIVFVVMFIIVCLLCGSICGFIYLWVTMFRRIPPEVIHAGRHPIYYY